MKKLLTSIMMLLAPCFCLTSQAQTSELAGKIISVGSAVTELETGVWYVLYNAATTSYALEGPGNTLGVTTQSPNGADAQSNAGYLVMLEETGSSNKYYLKSGLGNYYCNVTTSKNNGTAAEPLSKYAFAFGSFTTPGHWSIKSNNLYFLQSTNGTLKGASSKGSEGSDRDWAFRQVTFTDLSDLSGTAYVNYVLSNTNIVRPPKNDNTFEQVWLLSKSGSGYTLRNASTARFLDDDNNFRDPSASATTIYIQLSPNNGANDAYINLSEKSDFSGLSCLNLGNDGTTLYKWSYQGDQGCDWSISLVENYTMEEVQANLLAQSGLSEPVEGKYYRIRNFNKKNYINENFSSNIIFCEGKNEEKLSQYWMVVPSTRTSRTSLISLSTRRILLTTLACTAMQATTSSVGCAPTPTTYGASRKLT